MLYTGYKHILFSFSELLVLAAFVLKGKILVGVPASQRVLDSGRETDQSLVSVMLLLGEALSSGKGTGAISVHLTLHCLTFHIGMKCNLHNHMVLETHSLNKSLLCRNGGISPPTFTGKLPTCCLSSIFSGPGFISSLGV